jgi:hypothetical protein
METLLPGCVPSEVNTKAEATAEHQAHDTTVYVLCGIQAEAEGIVEHHAYYTT